MLDLFSNVDRETSVLIVMEMDYLAAELDHPSRTYESIKGAMGRVHPVARRLAIYGPGRDSRWAS